MYLSIFLHFYQPSYQQPDILEAIVNQSYRPLLKVFKQNPTTHVTININGGLLDLLRKFGYQDVIDDFNNLLKKGRIELTGSAKYHAFLPLIPREEQIRQIKLNEESLKNYFGEGLKLRGFFPPELAYSFKLARLIEELGYEWTVAPQIAYGPEKPISDCLYRVWGLGGLKIYFRDKRASVLILSGLTRSVESFIEEVGWTESATSVSRYPADDRSVPVDVVRRDTRLAPSYTLIVMDAETFGHHRPGLEKFLDEIFKSDKFKCLQVSEISDYFSQIKEVEPRASTWSNEEQDFWLDKEKGVAAENPFLLWKDPSNPIHKLQWGFVEFVLRTIRNEKLKIKNEKWEEARELLDGALSSDMFWWASAKPWWSLEMIELGAFKLREVIQTLCHKPSGTLGFDNKDCKVWLAKAEDYYRRILDLAFEWQRSGKIRRAHQEASKSWKKTPFKKRTPAEWYNQMILEFEDEMKKAAANLEFEKAIKWRDAIIKLKSGSDPYDALHVVDELWSVRKIPSVKPFLKHKSAEFSKFATEHFEPVKSELGLEQALLENYAVEKVKFISPILGGLQHRHFFVATDRGDWRLRLYLENKSDWSDVANEYKALEVLIAAGLPVYQPVLNRQGKFLTHSTTNGAAQVFSMVTFLPGEPLVPDKVEKEHLRVVGEVLAKIHRAFGKLPFDSTLPRLDVYQKFSSAQEGFGALVEQNYSAVDQTKLTRIEELVERVRGLVKDSQQDLLARSAFGAEQLLHGDYAQSNLLFKDGELSGILDFTSVAWGLPIDDLTEGIVGFYWVINNFTAEEFIENFVAGYKLQAARLIRLLVIMGLARRLMEAFKKPPTVESGELQQRWIEKFSNKLETIL